MKNFQLFFFLLLFCRIIYPVKAESSVPDSNIKFSHLAYTWDEAIPLGNGILGALVWQKGDNLRYSLDRADLWDLRPMENVDKPEFSFKWVQQQVKNNNYKVVHASQPVGWFRFEQVPKDFIPVLVPPQYQKEGKSKADNELTRDDLQRLGYEQGKVVREPNKLVYRRTDGRVDSILARPDGRLLAWPTFLSALGLFER